MKCDRVKKRHCRWGLLLLFVISCAGGPNIREPNTAHVIKGVPFYPQEENQCGPASLAGVLNYWGVPVSPAEIAQEIYSRSAKGTLNLDLRFYAERKGLTAKHYEGSWEDLKKKVDSGYPLIVLVDHGFWVYHQYHFMIVLGYDEGGIVAHSGKEKHRFVPLDRFLKSWRRAASWTLFIVPER